MAILKIKKLREPSPSEQDEPKLKKIRIKTKLKEEPVKKPKLKINLKKKGASQSSSLNIPKNNLTTKLKSNLKKPDEKLKKEHKTPRLRLKPIRVPGEGYDSEASDIEDDPLIEEGIILRVLPDIQAEFVKNSIESGDFSGIIVKWKGERHAIVNINDVPYGAILLDLPTITEVTKSVDRKNLIKTFDVSQMLLCIKPISNEEQVFTLQAPDSDDVISKHFEEYLDEINEHKKLFMKGYNGGPLTESETKYLEDIAYKAYQYRHGLTPPLYNVRNRRFRRKMGPTEFEYAEKVVAALLEQDDNAEEVTYDLVDEYEILRRPASVTDMKAVIEPPKEHIPSFALDDEDKEDDELDLDQAFESEDEEKSELPSNIQTPSTSTVATEQKLEETGDDVEQYNSDEEEEEDEDDEEDEDEDEEDNNGEKCAVDEDIQHNELLKDELIELESILSQTREKLDKATNPLLKSRFIDSIKKIEKEVDLKRKQLKLSDDTLLHQDDNEEDNAQEEDGDIVEEEDEDEDEEDEEEEDAEEDEQQAIPAASASREEQQNGDQEEEKEAVLDQNDLDMMMLFGAEGDDADD